MLIMIKIYCWHFEVLHPHVVAVVVEVVVARVNMEPGLKTFVIQVEDPQTFSGGPTYSVPF